MSLIVRFGLLSLLAAVGFAQTNGVISGTVKMQATGDPLHHASILLIQLGKTVETDNEGRYQFANVPPGKYTLVAHMHALSDDRKSAEITAGGAATVDFNLRINTVKQEVTVTASLKEETALETFNSTTSLDAIDLTEKQGASLGDLLDKETGVAKRSYGPGTTRPVLRGFDGDRVMVLQDGMPTGTLSSQSGDHGEPVNPYSLERVEVVRGPATLLYGTNAIGGVVSMVTGHHQFHQHPHEGLRGYVTGTAGSNNSLGGLTGGFEYGIKKWLIYGDGGGTRTSDYKTPLGPVENSGTRVSNAMGGVARYADRGFFNIGYSMNEGEYQIPFIEGAEERVSLPFRRHNVRFTGGAVNPFPWADNFTLSANYSDWNHREIANGEVGTEFFNKIASVRGVFEQKKRGALTGQFGFWGLHRDYNTVGDEAIAPHTNQNGVAAFAVEQLNFERVRFQFGGRIENNRYKPQSELPARDFTGFSGAVGMNVPLWNGGVAVANYSHSYRAPALEELFNLGPHAGNLTYEVGNPNLFRELSNGADFAVRHQGNRIRGEVNYFYYRLTDFVYLAPTGNIEEGLIEAEYSQANARYQGVEAKLSAALHPSLWLNLATDSVFAELRDKTKTPLPRIPPVRGRVGVEYRYKDFSFAPELVLSNRQARIFPTETETAGYALFNVRGTYTKASKHIMHFFAVNLFNANDTLYRNHLSFIKDYAPEIGRGVQFSYTMRFY